MIKRFIYLLFFTQSNPVSSNDFGFLSLQTYGLGDSLKFDYPNFGPGTQQFS